MQPFPSCFHSWKDPDGEYQLNELILCQQCLPSAVFLEKPFGFPSVVCGCTALTGCEKGIVAWRLGEAENRLQAPQLVLADRKCHVGCSLDNLQMVFQLEIPEKNGFIEWASSQGSYHCRGLPTAGLNVLIQVTIAVWQWNNHAPECLLTSSDEFTTVPRAMVLPWWQG